MLGEKPRLMQTLQIREAQVAMVRGQLRVWVAQTGERPEWAELKAELWVVVMAEVGSAAQPLDEHILRSRRRLAFLHAITDPAMNLDTAAQCVIAQRIALALISADIYSSVFGFGPTALKTSERVLSFAAAPVGQRTFQTNFVCRERESEVFFKLKQTSFTFPDET